CPYTTLSRSDVRVNGIAPGPIMWPQQGMTEQLKGQIVANTALKRAGSPRDVAGLVLYLVRDATYVTGQIIAVDGGRSIGWGRGGASGVGGGSASPRARAENLP